MSKPRQTGKHALLTTNQQTRSDELLTISVLIALLLLVGIVGLFWSTWSRVALGPTPTPTVTKSASVTPTPDLPATRIASQLATQTIEAREVALAADSTQTVISLLTSAPTLTGEYQARETQTAEALVALTLTAEATIENRRRLTATAVITSGQVAAPTVVISGTIPAAGSNGITSTNPNSNTVKVPVFVNSGANATQTSDTDSEPVDGASTPANTPLSSNEDGNEGKDGSTPGALPGSTGVYVPVFFPQPDETPAPTIPAQPPTDVLTNTPTIEPTSTITTVLPTETPTLAPTLTPTPVPTLFVQAELDALISVGDNERAKLRSGPRGQESGEMDHNSQVSLKSRTNTGEWINVCCLNEQVGWVRQTELKIENNVLDEGAPEDADANDIRWLAVEQPPFGNPMQVLLPPDGAYPLLRGNSANHGTVGELPTSSVALSWEGKASADILSPITLSASNLFVNTQDGHLYSYTKDVGKEQWRVRYEEGDNISVSQAVVVNGAELYTVSDSGTVYRINDQTNTAVINWRSKLVVGDNGLTPVTNINLSEGRLYVGAKFNDTHYLVGLRQSDGLRLFEAKPIEGTSMQYPAIGGQLVFVGTERGVFARDGITGDEVWSNTEALSNISVPPVYAFPGIDALSELYVVRSDGELVALNANTGARLWSLPTSSTITGIALDDEYLYLSGSGFVKVISRTDHNEVTNIGVNGNILTGPILSPTTIMVVAESGGIIFVEKNSWQVLDSNSSNGSAVSSFAANGSFIYTHDGGTIIRGLQSQ